jgi:hypothetical protein
MIAIYYGNAWNSRDLPFLNGVLDKSALAKYGLPRLTGTFAYAMFMANAAVSFPSRVNVVAC